MARFYGIVLIMALVVVSGVIAYVGDILGRRMGRKRLSLFGMRPRHTAIAISVVAGMLITLFTLATAMLASRDVKDGFLRVDDMRRAEARLSREVKDLDQRVARLDSARKEMERQLAQSRRDLAATRQAGERAQVHLAQTQQSLTAAKTELAQRTRELASKRAELARATKEVSRLTGVLTRLTNTVRDLSRRVDTLRTTATRATQRYVLERSLPILFGAQQPLDAQLIAGGEPVASARLQLERLLERLAERVTQAGARPLPGTDEVVIVNALVRDPETNRVTVARPSQVLDAVATSIHESEGDVIVRAYSVFNTHSGEPVYVDFQLFRNLLVFRRGETLAETLIDGRLSEPALMGALVSLLRDEVGARARSQNVMPRVAPGSPNLFAPTAGSVGEMSYDDLFDVIARLRRANGVARVTAVAAHDTWTIGPLEVDLKVEPIAVATGPRSP